MTTGINGQVHNDDVAGALAGENLCLFGYFFEFSAPAERDVVNEFGHLRSKTDFIVMSHILFYTICLRPNDVGSTPWLLVCALKSPQFI